MKNEKKWDMFGIVKKRIKRLEDKYELTKSVALVDVKGYLQKEYERANERENMISALEKQIKELNKTSLKYDAMLVIQEETQKRIEKQNEQIKELKEEIKEKNVEITLAKSKQTDIKVNAERKLKEKDEIIKTLKTQIKELEKPKRAKKKVEE